MTSHRAWRYVRSSLFHQTGGESPSEENTQDATGIACGLKSAPMYNRTLRVPHAFGIVHLRSLQHHLFV